MLLISSEETHRKLYRIRLEKYFVVEVALGGGATGKVDAVVYDIPKLHSTIDVKWLKNVDLPVVVLSCESRLRVGKSPRLRILTYPVRMGQIVQALAELGVKAKEDR